MNKSLVSVITITYNLKSAGRDDYVRQMIESVQKQTYGNIEHLIIDGASDDGTLNIFNDYPQLKVFSQKDKGIYDAMNKGVSLANGKYVVFLNSDDFWHDIHAVEESVKALEENDADFSYAPAKYLDENDKFVTYFLPSMETFFVRMPFCHQSMFTKKELVNFNDKYRSSGDYDFVLRLILSGAKGVAVPLNFTSYRWIGMSSGNSDDYGNSGCKLGDEESAQSIADNFSKYGISLDDAKDIYYRRRIPHKLLTEITKTIEPSLAAKINKRYLSRKSDIINVFSDVPLLSCEKKLKLGKITILRVKHYEKFKVYYLFKFLPILVLPI